MNQPSQIPNPAAIAKMSHDQKVVVFKQFMAMGYSAKQAMKMAKI